MVPAGSTGHAALGRQPHCAAAVDYHYIQRCCSGSTCRIAYGGNGNPACRHRNVAIPLLTRTAALLFGLPYRLKCREGWLSPEARSISGMGESKSAGSHRSFSLAFGCSRHCGYAVACGSLT